MQPHEGVIIIAAFGVALVEDELPLVVKGICDGVRDEIVELVELDDVEVLIKVAPEEGKTFSKVGELSVMTTSPCTISC